MGSINSVSSLHTILVKQWVLSIPVKSPHRSGETWVLSIPGKSPHISGETMGTAL